MAMDEEAMVKGVDVIAIDVVMVMVVAVVGDDPVARIYCGSWLGVTRACSD